MSGDPDPDPLELADAIERLPVRIERVSARHGSVAIAGYGNQLRPTGLVRAEGGDHAGFGECVAWTTEDQARFASRCSALLAPGLGCRVGELPAAIREATLDRYERAALEAAILDLALRQARTNLFRLAGCAARPVRFLLSFGTFVDPAAELRRILSASPKARVKLDVDPGWPGAIFAELAALSAVAVLDLKLRGGRELAERAHAAMPEALLEDPRLDIEAEPAPALPPSLAARVAFDGPVLRAADVTSLPLRPAAVNVKPSRMGGFLEALRAIAACRREGIATYVGGMFEVGRGRSQIQVLASLFSPDSWNDIAPLPPSEAGPWAESPLRIPEHFTGLGFG